MTNLGSPEWSSGRIFLHWMEVITHYQQAQKIELALIQIAEAVIVDSILVVICSTCCARAFLSLSILHADHRMFYLHRYIQIQLHTMDIYCNHLAGLPCHSRRRGIDMYFSLEPPFTLLTKIIHIWPLVVALYARGGCWQWSAWNRFEISKNHSRWC